MAKEQGRNCYRFFTQEINERIKKRLSLESRLRGALSRGEMALFYQPIIDLHQERPVALEALIRWLGRDSQSCGPAQFIPVAEEIGIIRDIGNWVLATACSDIRRFFNGNNRLQRVAINVSPRQLRAPGFYKSVSEMLEEHKISADMIEMEITESVLMDDTSETRINMTALCDMGIRLSIDDFGTGYSSLGYLQRYPFDTLKIDQSFISAIPHNPNARRLVETIIGMAQGLDLDIVAEGVETEDQLSFLRSRGCGLGQGYLFSTPAPLNELMAAGLFSELHE
jgi:EAL domain-containing protein (putative c-di-GMP-specific phosphodiesterase class I)